MRIISYLDGGTPSLGVLTSDTMFAAVHELDPKLPRTLDTLLAQKDGLTKLTAAAKGKTGNHALADAELAMLLQQPHGFWALALNFKNHIQETGLTTSDKFPQI